MKKGLTYGILASFFFAFTFVLNSSMNTGGGNWMWSSALRYIFMLPMLYLIVLKQNKVSRVMKSIKENLFQWLIWSTIGFGMFYAPLTFASIYGESWLVAGCWQITIICGVLLTPLFGQKIPLKNLLISAVILIGVFILQYEQAADISLKQALLSIIPIIIAAFAYPLGNRKMMHVCRDSLSTIERIFGMTLCSMPFWMIISLGGYLNSGMPGKSQLIQSVMVAVFSGVIATSLFFKATELVKSNPHQLAIIEATQSGEVIFTVIGEIVILGGVMPQTLGWTGLAFIVAGIVLNSFVSE